MDQQITLVKYVLPGIKQRKIKRPPLEIAQNRNRKKIALFPEKVMELGWHECRNLSRRTVQYIYAEKEYVQDSKSKTDTTVDIFRKRWSHKTLSHITFIARSGRARVN